MLKKWKTARDYYIREKKKANEERSSSAAKKKKSCPYFQLLQFLNVTKESRNSSSNVATPENTDNDSNVTGNENDEENIYDESESPSSQALSQPLSSQPASMVNGHLYTKTYLRHQNRQCIATIGVPNKR